ncbi:MAG: sulfatase-like hydrolase/transferase [Planctomycetota bacterium]
MSAMDRRNFLKGLGGTAAMGALGASLLPRRAAAQAAGQKPNIIFILSDDYGIGGIGCYGSDRYKTPNLDALAQTGLRFECCFSAPLCAPSRALCMTGRYGFRTGTVNNGTGGEVHPDKEVCIAKVMKQAGYATAVAGKWRQLSYFTTKEDAERWGFDEFLIWGVNEGEEEGEGEDEGKAKDKAKAQAKGSRYWDPDFNKNGQPMADTQGKYGPDLLHEFVVDFIERHREQPFFIYYPTPLIHGPILRTPDSPEAGSDLYADNIAYLDRLVGKLAAELDRLNLRERTLIVFTGDNGCTGQAAGDKAKRSGGTIGGRPIDGAKGSMKEGGSRVPLIVNWKRTAPQGKVLNDLVDFSDFFATFAELAGAKLPEGVTLDGHSFAPQLMGQPGKPREWIFVQLSAAWYVRDARWKLNQQGELFDMKDAPFQEVLVSPDGADPQAQAARAKLQAALDSLRPQDGATGAGARQEKANKKERRKGKRKKKV